MKRLIVAYFTLVILTLYLSISSAKTWYIKPDGTGDAPTIKAGVDSSMAGDTVLVAAGTYEEEKIILKGGIVLISEDGPNFTKIVNKPDPFEEPVIVGTYLETRTDINGFWITGYTHGIFAAISLLGCIDTYIMNCIFTGNILGIQISGKHVYIKYNTFFGNGYGLDVGTDGEISNNIIWDRVNIFKEAIIICYCNDFMDLSDASWIARDNFSEDPEFCGGIAGNFYLQSDSPCVPGNHPDGKNCGLIGALPVGCGTTPTENKTWGEIKEIYKE